MRRVGRWVLMGYRGGRAFMRAHGFGLSLCACLAMLGVGMWGLRERAIAPEISPAPTAAPFVAVRQSRDETLPKAQTRVPSGSVLRGYTAALRWSEELAQYRTHEGVDYAAPLGSAVYALRDGTVVAAFEDAMLGYTVSIDEADGCLTRYANLASIRQVVVGQKVRAGDIIGSVGDSAASEAMLPAHIHIDRQRDGAFVDPAAAIEQTARAD